MYAFSVDDFLKKRFSISIEILRPLRLPDLKSGKSESFYLKSDRGGNFSQNRQDIRSSFMFKELFCLFYDKLLRMFSINNFRLLLKTIFFRQKLKKSYFTCIYSA